MFFGLFIMLVVILYDVIWIIRVIIMIDIVYYIFMFFSLCMGDE